MASYHAGRPTDLRRSTPWHRLSHIVALLPARLGELARDLGAPRSVLDYGSAEAPYRAWFPDADWVTADLPGNPGAALELRADGTVPAADASFDAVVSTQVLEHVDDPEVYLAECFRVLRPGGRMLLSTHGMMVYHPDPVDYWRWTGAGLQRAVTAAGFEIVRFEGVMGLAASGVQFVQEAFYYRLPRYLQAALAVVMQLLIRLFDRLESAEAKRMNALVFALVAVKP